MKMGGEIGQNRSIPRDAASRRTQAGAAQSFAERELREGTPRPIGADEFRGDPERLLRRMAQLSAQSPDRQGGFFDFLTGSLQKPAQSPDRQGGFFDFHLTQRLLRRRQFFRQLLVFVRPPHRGG